MEIITTMDVSKRMDKLNCYALGFLRARYYVRDIADTPPDVSCIDPLHG